MTLVANQQPIRALLVAPPGVSRRGVELLLTAYGVCVGAVADDGLGAATALRRTPIDVSLVDLALGSSARAAVERIIAAAPRIGVLAYGDRRPWPVQELLDAGLRGFALTTCEPMRFLEAIGRVAAGANYMDPDFALADRGDPDRLARRVLSARERQILGLLSHGLTGREIAAQLFLSPATVRTHVQNAMQKLGARTRAQAIAIATGDTL